MEAGRGRAGMLCACGHHDNEVHGSGGCWFAVTAFHVFTGAGKVAMSTLPNHTR
jgi:hypothetical protein